jgi:hypothetical protein
MNKKNGTWTIWIAKRSRNGLAPDSGFSRRFVIAARAREKKA